MGNKFTNVDDEIYAIMRFLFLFAAVCTLGNLRAQTEEYKTSVPQSFNSATLEVKPEFPGGLPAFYAYLAKNFRTPNVPGLAGKIFVSFVIETDGSVADIKVIRDLGYGTKEETIRLLKNSPQWIPGEQYGEKVRVQFSIPLTIGTKK